MVTEGTLQLVLIKFAIVVFWLKCHFQSILNRSNRAPRHLPYRHSSQQIKVCHCAQIALGTSTLSPMTHRIGTLDTECCYVESRKCWVSRFYCYAEYHRQPYWAFFCQNFLAKLARQLVFWVKSQTKVRSVQIFQQRNLK